MARMPYVVVEQSVPEVREVFEKMVSRGAKVANVYRMMAHSPTAFLPFMRFGNALLQRASLDPKLRELTILRVATLTGSRYEWQQHEHLAKGLGVTAAQVAAIGDWEHSAAFDERERAVLRYVDDVAQNVAVTDQVFASVRQHLNETEMVELTLSIGFWGMLARFLEPMQVDLEEEAAGSIEALFGRPKRA